MVFDQILELLIQERDRLNLAIEALVRDIAGVIGRRLNAPVVSKSASEAEKQFGFIARPVLIDNPTSSNLTRERLGWTSTNMGLIADLEQTDSFPRTGTHENRFNPEGHVDAIVPALIEIRRLQE